MTLKQEKTNGNRHESKDASVVDVDCLIVGTGPAGSGLATFLAQNGQ